MGWVKYFNVSVTVMIVLLVVSCTPKVDKMEDTIEKWRIMAEQSQGHSPSPMQDLEEVQDLVIESKTIESGPEKVVRSLPQFNVTLRMHDADLVAVLQALSRAAKQSIVVSPTVKGNVNINVVEMPWAQVFEGILSANLLTYTWEGDLIRVLTAADMKQDLEMDVLRKKQQAERLAMAQVEPLQTSIVRVKYGDAAVFKESLTNFLSKDEEGKPLGSVEVDTDTNALIVQAVGKDLKRIVKMIEVLDKPRAQIKIKAHIIETTKETARALGVQWAGAYQSGIGSGRDSIFLTPGGALSGDTTSRTGFPLAPDYVPTYGTSPSGQGYGVSFPIKNRTQYSGGSALGLMLGEVGGDILEVQLQALEEDNKLHIISSPSITTMDNQKAYTESGERVPFQTTESSGGIVTTSVKFEDVLLRLEITPHVIDAQFIKMEIIVKKDEVDTSRTIQGNPYILKKATETSLIARNGETVVISGLSKHKANYFENGLPGLKDIPGAGHLFGGETDAESKTEFMIFITPQVLAKWMPGERQKTLEEIEEEIKEKKRLKELEENGGSEASGEETG